MSLESVTNNIKKKISLNDMPTDVPQNSNTVTQHVVETFKPENVFTSIQPINPGQQEVETVKPQKVKVTIYMTEEHFKMFNELCIDAMKTEGKPEKSQIICDAIETLYEKRKKNGNINSIG